jgi:hypothetical protein
VFAVLGGIPSRYEELWRNSMIDLEAGRDTREVIGAHLCAAAAAIYAAINLVIDSKSQAVDMKEIIKMFAKDNSSTLTTQHELSCKLRWKIEGRV